MNAVARKSYPLTDHYLAVSEDVSMEEGFGELRADVRHIRFEVTEIKADARATNVRLDDWRKEMSFNVQAIRSEFSKKVDDLADKMTEGQKEAATRMEKMRVELTDKIDDVKDRVENVRSETADKFDRVEDRFDRMQLHMDSSLKELAGKIDGVKDSLSQSKVWALGLLCIGLTGALLLVMAHGFKWL